MSKVLCRSQMECSPSLFMKAVESQRIPREEYHVLLPEDGRRSSCYSGLCFDGHFN